MLLDESLAIYLVRQVPTSSNHTYSNIIKCKRQDDNIDKSQDGLHQKQQQYRSNDDSEDIQRNDQYLEDDLSEISKKLNVGQASAEQVAEQQLAPTLFRQLVQLNSSKLLPIDASPSPDHQRSQHHHDDNNQYRRTLRPETIAQQQEQQQSNINNNDRKLLYRTSYNNEEPYVSQANLEFKTKKVVVERRDVDDQREDQQQQQPTTKLMPLDEAVNQVSFSGFIVPSWLLISGPVRALQAIRLAWLESKLTPPIGFKIKTIGKLP